MTEVEIDRALNALSTTLNDQKPDNPSVTELQAIVDEEGELVAVVERDGADSWTVAR